MRHAAHSAMIESNAERSRYWSDQYRSLKDLNDKLQARNLVLTPRPRKRASAWPSYGSFDASAKYVDGLRNLQAAYGLQLDFEKIRTQARIAYHDSSVARSIVNRYANFGVGDGLFLEASPIAEILGRDADSLAEWALDAQRRFNLWAASKESHIEKHMTLYQLQRFLLTGQKRDGEYFVRLHYADGELRFGTFDPTQIEEGTTGQTTYLYGVHRDKNGAIDAYRIRVSDSKVVIFPAFTPDGKPLILHGYAPDYSGQVRGISEIAHVLQECRLLSDYQINELIKSALQAAINLWVRPSQNAPATNILDGMTVGAGPLAGYAEASIPNEPDPNDDPVNYKRMDEAPVMAGGIGVFNLNAGEALEAFKPTAPSEAYSSFEGAIKNNLFASMDLPPEIGKLTFNSNYSASQAAILLFWAVLQIARDDLASDFLNPLYDAWLNNEIAENRIACPGWSDPFLRKCWANCKWTGRGRPQIDAEQQGRGYKEFVELGAKTLEEIARETNGSNAAVNRAKLRRELAELPTVPWNKSVVPPKGSTDGK